jgi:putative component of membrane protein insertase Oxa1/YidC/SpoIIIJ protein YidD
MGVSLVGPQRTSEHLPEHQHGRLTERVLHAIDRHRHTSVSQRGTCRFTPSCSHYAEELFRTRAFPIALVLTVARIIRCNPIAKRKADDPVRRTRRWRPRPNALPTFFAVLALSGFVVVATAGIAEAVGVNNGCTATINTRDPASMTKGSPLVVHKGENVAVRGQAPPSARASGPNTTVIEVSFIEGIAKKTSKVHRGDGPAWGGTQNVDDYLKYGVGLYKVKGVAQGSPGWSCQGSGYVELRDGNPLGKPIGGGAGVAIVLGLVGAAAASRGGEPDASAAKAADPGPDDDEVVTPHDTEEEHVAAGIAEDIITKPNPGEEGLAGFACLILILIAIGAAFASSGIAAGAVGAVPAARRRRTGRVWGHGHPIVGFISGLILGLGITVLLQQFAVWPLTIVTAIVFPLVVALICAIRAYMGRPYKVVRG